MVFAIAVCELHIPAARGLKSKRRVVRSLIERIHARHRVSIAETKYHDLHQRAEIGIAAVHQSEYEMERMLQAIRRTCEEADGAILVDWQSQLLEGWE